MFVSAIIFPVSCNYCCNFSTFMVFPSRELMSFWLPKKLFHCSFIFFLLPIKKNRRFIFFLCALESHMILKDSLQHRVAEGYPSQFWIFHKSTVTSISSWHSVQKGWRKGNCNHVALEHTGWRNSSAGNTTRSRSFLNRAAVQADQSEEGGLMGVPAKRRSMPCRLSSPSINTGKQCHGQRKGLKGNIKTWP